MPGMTKLLEELKRGDTAYTFFQTPRFVSEYWPRVAASQYFDGTLISADVKLVKPQPEIYSLLCQSFGLSASECFMIDDVPQNIEGAFEAGMSGFVFNEDVTTLRNALKRAGVKLG